MTTDYVFMIPHLSKELNLFGLSSLPYNVAEIDKSKSYTKINQNTSNITFNSKSMIDALIKACFELIKQVKSFGVDEDHTADKINFENIRLEKQLKLCKSEIEKKINDLQLLSKMNQNLQEQNKLLKDKLKNCQIKLRSLEKKSETDIDLLKHALKKKELELSESFKTQGKISHYVDQKKYEVQQNQPDFSKLWSTVKYSDAKTREEALKEAICIFQRNNKALTEEEFFLKSLLSNVLQKIHEMLELMINKMQIPYFMLPSFKCDMFWNLESFDVLEYNKLLEKHLKVFTKVFESVNKASFVVSDDLFVCLSHVFEDLKLF